MPKKKKNELSSEEIQKLNEAYRSYITIRKTHKNADETWKDGTPGDILLQYSKVETIIATLNPEMLEQERRFF
jgi:hypothetical protein